MDGQHRLKIKVGPHEFESEGSADSVREHFEAFTKLVSAMPASALAQPQNKLENPASPAPAAPAKTDWTPVDDDLRTIMRVEGRVVSLTARPSSADDAVMLMLLGQKVIRQNDSVTGSEIIEGLAATGGLSVDRVDRLLEKLARAGEVMLFGERRAKRYRLTNTGTAKARELANGLIATVS